MTFPILNVTQASLLVYCRDKSKETNITGDGEDVVDHGQSEQQQLVTESVTEQQPLQHQQTQSSDTTANTTEQPKKRKSGYFKLNTVTGSGMNLLHVHVY